jgi:3-oxoacyl-[acyl-carrier protein] reductase
MRAIPETTASNGAATIRIRVTPALVSAFAALTGDRSNLHVDSLYARRSAYRRPVAHGMLPVAFLALLPVFRSPGLRYALRSLTGRFTSPVFPGETLTLTATPARMHAAGSEVTLDYQIVNDASRAVVTDGTLTVSSEVGGSGPRSQTSLPGATLLTVPAALGSYRLEDIEPGAGDRLEFAVTGGVIADFAALLEEGAGSAVDRTQLTSAPHVPTLLSMLLYSTSIGVSLPGASATFLEFSASVERPVEPGALYHLAGRVTHRSISTRIVKKELCVTAAGSGEVVLRGKASTLVAKPFQSMPTSEELREATDFGLAGKVVLITGASRGIGETTAKLFALHGAKVIVNYHQGAADAARVVEEITAAGGQAVAIQADVSSPDAVRSMVERGRNECGPIDILVNNAARDFRPAPFLHLTWEEVQKDLDVIAKGAFLCCQAVIPSMLERGGGRIINISTVATDDPPPGQVKYVMAKSALVGLTRSLSIEFASKKIQVNLVVPNFVETDLVAHVQDGFRKKIAQETPMQRVASPVDVARAVLVLASSYSSFTTGQKVMVTGGGPPYA